MVRCNRCTVILLTLLALTTVITICIKSSYTYFWTISPDADLLPEEFPRSQEEQQPRAVFDPKREGLEWDGYAWIWQSLLEGEKIPRILHRTWKTDDIPEIWQDLSGLCQTIDPDYQVVMWTDEKSRRFIDQHANWFLPTFDNYPHPIQRADAIRYFALQRYGGIYMDLDMGCSRSLNPLLRMEVLLSRTRPVGVSNDLIFTERDSDFMKFVVDSLQTWNRNFIFPYLTVIFSTGPMFLSTAYTLYTSRHRNAVAGEARVSNIRLLSHKMYDQPNPDVFVIHGQGATWHHDDSQLFTAVLNRVVWFSIVPIVISAFYFVKYVGRKRR